MDRKPSEVLIAAASLLSDERHWCQGTLAIVPGLPDGDGGAHHERAISWCSLGALHKVTVRPSIWDFRAMDRVGFGDLSNEDLVEYCKHRAEECALAEEAESFLGLSWSLISDHTSVVDANDDENTDHALVLDRFQVAAQLAKREGR